MYVYIAKLKDKDVFKIGSTVNPKQRINALNKRLGFDLTQTYACKVGDSYKGVEQKLIEKYSEFHEVMIVEQGGNEIFNISCFEDAKASLSEYGELIEHFYFPVIKSTDKIHKRGVEERHKLACEWLEENQESVDEFIDNLDVEDGKFFYWLIMNKLSLAQVYQLFNGQEIKLKLSLDDIG